MKLKLFIIALIAISFAVTGLLGGCGGKKKNTADEPRDDTICISINKGQNTKYTMWGTADGQGALAGYDDDDNLIWLSVCIIADNGDLSTDTLYVLAGVTGGNDQIVECYDLSKDDYVDFDATSSKSNIAKLERIDSSCWRTTSYNTTGESTINIKTADGKKTWFTVIVVDGMSAAPEFIPDVPL